VKTRSSFRLPLTLVSRAQPDHGRPTGQTVHSRDQQQPRSLRHRPYQCQAKAPEGAGAATAREWGTGKRPCFGVLDSLIAAIGPASVIHLAQGLLSDLAHRFRCTRCLRTALDLTNSLRGVVTAGSSRDSAVAIRHVSPETFRDRSARHVRTAFAR
jgi:hypothetical protein